MAKSIHRQRITALQAELSEQGLDAALILDRTTTHWLTGFRGTASHLIVFPKSATFITDFRYIEVARKTLSDLRIVEQKAPFAEQFQAILNQRKVKSLGTEGVIAFHDWEWVKRNTPRGVKLIDITPTLNTLRVVKDSSEILTIRRAVQMTDEIFADGIRWLRRRLKNRVVTEHEMAIWLKRQFEERGAEGPSFPPIVAAGPNSANPHAVPGQRRIREGQYLLFDFGLVLDGYCSDMTRTVMIGKPTKKHQFIYDTVLEAQTLALEAVRAGIPAKDVDAAARDHIKAADHGKHFGHGTGHGVGLEIHEAPRVSAISKDLLEPGMVITVEPGIYLAGWGGVRIEDMVVVKEKGGEILTASTKKFLTL